MLCAAPGLERLPRRRTFTAFTRLTTLKTCVRSLLQVAGVGWLAGCCLGLWHVSQGSQKGDAAVPSVLLLGSIAGLCLWRGYAKD